MTKQRTYRATIEENKMDMMDPGNNWTTKWKNFKKSSVEKEPQKLNYFKGEQSGNTCAS